MESESGGNHFTFVAKWVHVFLPRLLPYCITESCGVVVCVEQSVDRKFLFLVVIDGSSTTTPTSNSAVTNMFEISIKKVQSIFSPKNTIEKKVQKVKLAEPTAYNFLCI